MNLSPILSKPIEFIEAIATNCRLPVDHSLPVDQRRPILLITKDEFGALKALSGYVKRDGLFGAIATVLHRIWNAIKAIFCQSDWQLAEKTITTLVSRVQPYAQQLGMSNHFLSNPLMRPNHPEHKKCVHSFMEDLVDTLSVVNEKLKESGVEPILLPLVDRALTMFDGDAIGKNLFRLSTIFQRLWEQNKGYPVEQQTSFILQGLKNEGMIKASVDANLLRQIIDMFSVRFRPQI